MTTTNKIIASIDKIESAIKNQGESTAEKVQEVVNHRIQQAFDAGQAIKVKAEQACDVTAEHIRDQPLKAVAIAGLAGAALAYVATTIVRRNAA